jgi:hypothetical protein
MRSATPHLGPRVTLGTVEMATLQRQIKAIPEKVLAKITRNAMRKWCRGVVRDLRRLAPKAKAPYTRYARSSGPRPAELVIFEQPGLLRKSYRVKVKRYKSGVVWAAAAADYGWDYSAAGWRSHFAENGFYNKRLRRRFPGTKYHALTLERHAPMADGMIRDDVERAIREVAKA